MDLATLKKTFAERNIKKVKVGGFDVDGVLRGKFGCSWIRGEQPKAFCHAILDEMASFYVGLEALHTETGPGVYEVAIRYDSALRAADKAALFKTQMKSLAARHGLAVTFMAKWN